jgi:hypothetical protein
LHDPDNGLHLEQQLLEPKLIGLMYDDKQHLVMSRLPPPKTLGMLGIQDLVQLQIIAIMNFVWHRYLMMAMNH